ncbi:hypothetical protein CYY_009277 [Polysphondylium violaceum]|uniref:Flavin-containing monooxygenase n=1 Tax=Polysphondylium violaceum TaxID=133409 RepID=A0A8J4UWB0_9MYCE|nr:hypothetical protein CYY_009277 [Polysphondylium violaceum]
MRVAIIGGGPGGLVSLKSCVEKGIDATLFEKEKSIGGVWAPCVGKTWNTLHTNTSFFSSMFSDFPWPKETELFPDQHAMYKYLNDYISHFKLGQYIKVSSGVNQVDRANDGKKWVLKWTDQQGTQVQDEFDYLIVATGVFSRPGKHDILGLDSFCSNGGQVLNISDYRDANLYRDKRVLVVGTSFSGAEAAGEIGVTSKYPVIQLINKPYYVMKKMTNGRPIDSYLFSREASDFVTKETDITKVLETIHGFYGMLSGQNENVESLVPDKSLPPYLTISNTYLDNIKNKNIDILLNKNCDGFDENGLLSFTNSAGQREKVKIDTIVFCDGYLCQVSFLPQEVKDKIRFVEQDKFLPLLLHKCVFAQDIPNIFFIGMYKGPSYGSMELQARWVSMIIAGQVPYPSEAEIKEGILEEEKIRQQRPRPQIPHPHHIPYCDYIARKMGVYPDETKLQEIYKTYPKLYKMLYNNLMNVACYRLWESIHIDPNSFDQIPCASAVSILESIEDRIYKS